MNKIISIAKTYGPYLLISLVAMWLWNKYFNGCNCQQNTPAADTGSASGSSLGTGEVAYPGTATK